MTQAYRHTALAMLLLFMIVALTSCSSQKNTARTRWWHSFNARYNTYYNASLAYIDGSLEKEKGNKDNFTEQIPFYTVGNKNSRELGKSNYDRAIEKCQKAIKLHSIKRRPEWTKSRRKTPRDIEWLSRKEYNPFIWKAWMLMGRSQFYSGNFDEAASTFSYMSRLYRTQPSIYGRARAWLAKCYVEQDMLYDAEDVIRNMKRDSIHWRAQKEWDFTYADYYIHNKEYEKAVPYIRKSIKHEMRRAQRARLWYLLGQIESNLGHKTEAMSAFKHCLRQNPPYETAFNARLSMAEVLSGQGQQKKMISKLKRMARNDNNKDYLDQVYYAMGNIHLSMRDTISALSDYEQGIKKATRSGIEKGVLLLKAGDVYWEKERYNDAQRCYGEAVGLLDQERDDYKQLSNRSKILDELVPHTDAIHLQDSLLALSMMDEKQRFEAIDRVIEQLKKKEKEEADRQAEQDAQDMMNANGGGLDQDDNSSKTKQSTTQSSQSNALWYFYNPTQVAQGKTAFQKKWGKRENADDWQRINQTVVASTSDENEEDEATDEQQEETNDSIEAAKDDPKNDPHKREYYLEQIPFTDEQKAACHEIIKEGLFNSGVIFKDKLDNLKLAQKSFNRLESQYPDYSKMADVYYHMFLLYSRLGDYTTADLYVAKLKAEFPDNQWTILLTDPLFEENARFGKHIEDSLYASAYDAFRAGHLADVRSAYHISETRFPLGDNRDKFIFINGLAYLDQNDTKSCLDAMKTVVDKYPKSSLAEMAGMIINGVKEGRQLNSGHFDISDIWSRRTAVMADSDSIAAQKLSIERNSDFAFIIVYHPDSVNENQLLYQMARHNFTNYLVRNFDINIETVEGARRMVIDGFRNFDEALQYARSIRAAADVSNAMRGTRSYVVSKENLPLLGKNFSYDEYDEFYGQNFAPLNIEKQPLLIEPDELHIRNEESQPTSDEDKYNQQLDDNTMQNGFEIIPEQDEDTNSQGTTVSTDDNNAAATSGNQTTVVPSEEPESEQAVQETVIDVPSEEPNSTIVPAESTIVEEPTTTTEQPSTTIETIPTEEESVAVDTPSEPAGITTVPAEEATETPTETTTVPTDKVSATEEPANTDSEDIYFDIDETEEETNSASETNPVDIGTDDNGTIKEPIDDTDDEYYDLDGF